MQERRKDMADIGSRVAVLETVFDEIRIIKADVKLILTTMAEQRGAAKAMKVIWGTAVAVLSITGGWVGSIVRHM